MSASSQGPGWWLASDGKWYPPQPQPPAKTYGLLSRFRALSTRVQFLVLVGVIGAFVALIAIGPTQERDDSARSERPCTHFRNVMGDVNRGVLTDSELRSKLKEIDDMAGIGTPAVQSAATSMLAAITGGSSTALGRAFVEMDSACDEAGY